MIETSWRCRLHSRIFWTGDALTDWLIDLPVARTKIGSEVIALLLTAEEWIQRLACLPLGHAPIADCADPAYDYCAWCRASTPGAAERKARS